MSRRKRGNDEEARDAEKEVGRNMWGGAICEEEESRDEEEGRDDDEEKEEDRDDDKEKEEDQDDDEE